MSTTALPAQRAPVKRNVTADSLVSSSTASPDNSPFDSPNRSPSQTSLSSLGEDETTSAEKSKLVDTWGNEFQIPDYTIKQLRDAIPARCFERSAVLGMYYVFRDMALIGTTFYIFHNYVTPEAVPNPWVRYPLWFAYTFLQGVFGTGLWVLAHEAGHQSFSPSKVLNDTVGWVLHSALLVPYFSWKISHGKHHKATGNIERDMVFVPATREQFATKVGKMAHELHELMEDTPIMTALDLLQQQLGGWPVYLLSNVTGHNFHDRQTEGKGNGKVNGFRDGVNHFFPSSPLFEKKDEHLILLSDLGLAITLSVLAIVGYKFGFSNLFVWYIAPYLWVNHWLVAITFLQHTDPTLPHYGPESWNFVRGAAATIDRNFWPIGPHFFHGIIETHVLHHYVSTIPFYHADEATEAIRPIMGRHYRADTDGGAWGFVKSLWRSARMCKWVEPNEGATGEGKSVLFFRNRNGLGLPPAKLAGPTS